MGAELVGVCVVIEEDHAARFFAESPSRFIKRDRLSSLAEVEVSIKIFSLAFDLGRIRLSLTLLPLPMQRSDSLRLEILRMQP